ncbi:MAG: peptide MFS transporter [Actinomycetales bacterium]
MKQQATPQGTSRVRQPKGVLTLAMVEMWERFSFYGMVALLVLYLIEPENGPWPPGPGQGFTEADAAALFGSYSALVMAAPLIGGWIGDRLIGPRRALVIGGILIAAGHFVLLVPSFALFWCGLIVIAAGTGLLKPNISAVLGALYVPGDERRDGGFSLFYLGINAGAFSAPLLCGLIATTYSWRAAFSIAGFGMLIGLGQYALGHRRLGAAGLAVPRPASARERRRIALVVVLSLALIAAAFSTAITLAGFSAAVISAVVSIVIVIASIVAFRALLHKTKGTPIDHRHVKAFLVLFLASVTYFVLSSQAGSTITEFTQDWIDRSVGAFTIPTSWLTSLNPILVVIFAPIFAALWTKLASRAPTTPTKVATSLVGVGLSFWVIALPGFRAENQISSGPLWILATFLVLTWAELLIVPIALSVTTELAPVGLTSQLLGLWYLAAAIGGSIGGQIARLVEVLGLGGYFLTIGLLSILVGAVFLRIRGRWAHLLAPIR